MKRDAILELFDTLRRSEFDITEFSLQEPLPTVVGEIGGIAMPRPLHDVYRREFGGIQATYRRKLDLAALGAFGESIGANYLYGGPILLPPSELVTAKSRAIEWAETVWADEDEDEYKTWTSTVPIAWIGNGDYLGFNAKERVVYMCHDGESFVVAADFESFFLAWENVFFIGPEWWMLEPLSNRRKRLLKSSQNIRQFKRAFQSLLHAA